MFQFSIGDAAQIGSSSHASPSGRVSILYWRCAHSSAAASRFRRSVSILYWRCTRTPTAPLQTDWSSFQFSIGDAEELAREVADVRYSVSILYWRCRPLEPVLQLRRYGVGCRCVSILYWRCGKIVTGLLLTRSASAFQFSIGDAHSEPRPHATVVFYRFNSLLEMRDASA